MAIIGQSLTAPESGWRRYDGQNNLIKFNGNWLTTTNTSYYNGTNIYSSDANAKLFFNFSGTRIRIIGYRDPARGIAKIKIDGIEQTYTQNGSPQFQTLVYEKTNLASREHYVEISWGSSSIDLDALDIDFSGELKIYNPYSSRFLISSEDKYFSLPYDVTDIIPQMTSDILPSGVATCSSTFSTSGAYNAFNAFDKNIVQSGNFNSWVTASGQLTGWLAYEFPDTTVVNKYTIVHGLNNVNVAPKSWTFEGTNDNGLNWTVLDQRSNVTDWILWTEKEFEFVNVKKFKKYRINITANNGNASYVGIQELKMYDTNRTLLFCSSYSEGIFIKYGIQKNETIETYKQMSKRSYLTTSSTQLGSGKVFKQKIDTSKTPIKKASIT
ncbi:MULTISPECIES: discoidin domain-containing protein [Paenibacillus]|uniref:discoidin domain-containing protein n=1 Tax=Paenibacillus TaxID=44249 RepID=UPI000B8088BD|nr:discoidin domain-containing protein [Paenibacillus amylolyticus]